MLGIKTGERPNAFAKLLPELAALRARTGRPHWLIIDEAHHLLPYARDGTSFALPKSLSATILITVHPDLVSRDVLAGVDTVMALGPEADKVVESFCAATEEQGLVLEPVDSRTRKADLGRASPSGMQASYAQICRG